MSAATDTTYAVKTRGLNLWYGTFQALFDINLDIKSGIITSLIGPSGCGKSTLLRSINRIIERLGYVRTEGEIEVLGKDIFGSAVAPERTILQRLLRLHQDAPTSSSVELIQVRKQIGMVFQRPNPLPLTVYENVLFGYRIHEKGGLSKADADIKVEDALRQVLLWDQIKDRLQEKATGLSLEEQQKLCIARLLPVKPAVLLMDEPCSALDPEATSAVEELIWELRGRYNIVIVTHNMAQARRASDECVFMLMGKVIEHTKTSELFVTPKHQETADYIEGRFG